MIKPVELQRTIRVKGSPFDQGETHGRLARPLIHKNIKLMEEVLEKSSFDKSEFWGHLKANFEFLTRTEPELVEELKGLAKGAEIDFAQILFINIPLFFVFNWLPPECTMVYFGPKATADGRSYLLKNRDMGFNLEHVVLTREYLDGRSLVELNGAGIITYPGNGLNSEGLALATTGVWSRRIPIDLDQSKSSHTLLNSHLVLENCSTVDQALSYLQKTPRMNGLNLILADKNKACAVELTRDGMVVEDCVDGVLFRSNHYVAEELNILNQTEEEYPSTYRRYERIAEYVWPRMGRLAFQDMLLLAQDHKNGPVNCICRHGTTDAPSKTIYSSIVVPEDEQVWTTLTNPCESLLATSLSSLT
jgi:predicted choloylglycine hydrolase